jgi:hypothetical protein
VNYWQFMREVGGHPVKLDFLAFSAPDAKVHVSGGRIRPHGVRSFHGRTTPEGFAVADGRIRVEIRRGDERGVTVRACSQSDCTAARSAWARAVAA